MSPMKYLSILLQGALVDIEVVQVVPPFNRCFSCILIYNECRHPPFVVMLHQHRHSSGLWNISVWSNDNSRKNGFSPAKQVRMMHITKLVLVRSCHLSSPDFAFLERERAGHPCKQ